MTKKIKLTEATLTRIVERVLLEKEKDSANQMLMTYFAQLKNADEAEKEELNAKISKIMLDNKALTPMVGALTPLGKKDAILK